MASNDNTSAANSPPPNAIMTTLPPTEARLPTSTPDTEADAHNTSILAVRGIRTTATGDALYELAKKALRNEEFDVGRSRFPSTSSEEPVVTFEPFYFFFYGSLQDRSMLRQVVGIPDRGLFNRLYYPEDDAPDNTIYIQNASITGWKVRMWGPYPALVPADDGTARGLAWLCEKPEYVPRLASYESDAYRMAYCDISVPAADGNGVEILRNARTFVTALDDNELEDGEFNLDEYRQMMSIPF
ncbi:hypothetical protein GGR51DRAFT_577906 [Nemania sp. FL0031]|nr:hypothetical protein GGR51DRAFT_577906 [Nemania sp. FL0031]